MKIDAAVDQWLEYLVLVKGKSESTIRSYRSNMRNLAKGITTVEEFTLNHVRGVLAGAQDKAASTRASWVTTAKLFAQYTDQKGWSDGGSMARLVPPKIPQRTAEHYTEKDTLALMDGMRATALPSTTAVRTWALFELVYGAGLRIEEACSMTLQSVDADSMKIRVRGKGDKDRVLPIGPNQLFPLVVWMRMRSPKNSDDQDLFLGEAGVRLSARQARRDMETACDDAGVSYLGPHALRHSCATHMIEGGADIRYVAEFLGHESLATTEKYLHVAMSRLVTVYQKAHPRERMSVSVPDAA